MPFASVVPTSWAFAAGFLSGLAVAVSLPRIAETCRFLLFAYRLSCREWRRRRYPPWPPGVG